MESKEWLCSSGVVYDVLLKQGKYLNLKIMVKDTLLFTVLRRLTIFPLLQTHLFHHSSHFPSSFEALLCVSLVASSWLCQRSELILNDHFDIEAGHRKHRNLLVSDSVTRWMRTHCVFTSLPWDGWPLAATCTKFFLSHLIKTLTIEDFHYCFRNKDDGLSVLGVRVNVLSGINGNVLFIVYMFLFKSSPYSSPPKCQFMYHLS